MIMISRQLDVHAHAALKYTALCLLALLLASCGGKGGGPEPDPESGNLDLTVAFHPKNRDLPGYASKAIITVTGNSPITYSKTETITNDATSNESGFSKTVSLTSLEVGTYTVTIEGQTAAGKVVASGSVSALVEKGKTASLKVSDNANESPLTIKATASANPIERDQITHIIPAAFDSSNTMILLSNPVWSITIPDPQKGFICDSSGNPNPEGMHVKAVGQGTIMVTAHLHGADTKLSSPQLPIEITTPHTGQILQVYKDDDPANSIMAVRRGYDGENFKPKSLGVFAEEEPLTLPGSSTPTITLETALLSDSSSSFTSRALSGEFSAQYFAAKAKAEYSRDTAASTVFNGATYQLRFRAEFPTRTVANPTNWTPEALNLWHTNLAQFRTAYGTHAVVGVKRTVTATINVSMSSNSSTNMARSYLMASGSYGGGFGSVSASVTLKSFVEEAKSRGTLNLSVNTSGVPLTGLPSLPANPSVDQLKEFMDALVDKLLSLTPSDAAAADTTFTCVPYDDLRAGGGTPIVFPTPASVMFRAYKLVNADLAALDRITSGFNTNGEYEWVVPAQQSALLADKAFMEQRFQQLGNLYGRYTDPTAGPNAVTLEEATNLYNEIKARHNAIIWPRISLRQLQYNGTGGFGVVETFELIGGKFTGMQVLQPALAPTGGNPPLPGATLFADLTQSLYNSAPSYSEWVAPGFQETAQDSSGNTVYGKLVFKMNVMSDPNNAAYQMNYNMFQWRLLKEANQVASGNMLATGNIRFPDEGGILMNLYK
jgi:hypothetical protein